MTKKANQSKNPSPAPSPTPEEFTESQREVLAKVYRFLLRFKYANSDGEKPVCPSDPPCTSGSAQAAKELPDE